MKPGIKRAISILVTIIMLISAVPLSASAAGDTPEKTVAFSLMKTDETVHTVCISLMLDRGIFSSVELEVRTKGLTCTGIAKGEMLERLYGKEWAECYFSANANTGCAAFLCSASYNYTGEFVKIYFKKDCSDYSVDVIIPACAVMQGNRAVELNVVNPKTLVNDVLYSKLPDLKLKYKDRVNLDARLVADSSKGTYAYYSSDPKIVSIDANGTVYALKKGTAEIKVIYSEPDSVPIFDTCTVTVRMTLLQNIIYYVFFGWIWY